MTTRLIVLDPTQEGVPAPSAQSRSLPADLRGVRIGVLDNGKPNSDRFLSLLGARFAVTGAAVTRTRRKPSIGRLAPSELLDELVATSDLVLTGVGDCAGCCSCSVADAIAIERRGTPTVVIATTEFLTTARIAASAAGIPDYPVVVIDHPLGSLTVSQLEQRADLAMGQVLDRIAGAR